jgi:hypothetical protein
MKKQSLFIVCFLLFTNLVSAQVPNYIPEYGLVGWWPFNGNANDESGNGNDGATFNTQLTTDRFLQNDKAYSFQSLGYIEILNNPSINLFQDFTISAWFLTFNSDNSGAILGKGKNEFSTGYALLHNEFDINNNEISFNTGMSLQNMPLYTTASESFIDQTNITPNIWYHLVSTYDGNTLKLYLNGVLVDTTNTNIQLYPNSETNLYFGKELTDFRFFTGKIDDIGMWNRPLTDEEVSKLYNVDSTETSVTPSSTINSDISVKIFPNPTTDIINIDFNDLNKVRGGKIKIMSMSGQIVYEENITQSKITLSVADRLSKGVYIVTTTDSGGNTISNEKLIVQ